MASKKSTRRRSFFTCKWLNACKRNKKTKIDQQATLKEEYDAFTASCFMETSDPKKSRWVNSSKRNRLRDMKVFVLDNSLRESTVGQVVGHSLRDKFEVLDEISKCGFNHQIVGAFGVARRVDDAFYFALNWLKWPRERNGLLLTIMPFPKSTLRLMRYRKPW